jgi:hypothetical protein
MMALTPVFAWIWVALAIDHRRPVWSDSQLR